MPIQNQAFYRFKKTNNLPEANEQIVNMLVGSTKDHKKVYKAVEKFYTIRNECMKAGISFEELVGKIKAGI